MGDPWPPPNVDWWSPWPTPPIPRLSAFQQDIRLRLIERWWRTGKPLPHQGPDGDLIVG
jgi:hypothetical protein